ncbi:MAG: MarR family winged helix-turn-helix transcriptional regulator [Gemmatimonadaceae bacterium]
MTPARADDVDERVATALRLYVVLARAQNAIAAHAMDDVKGDGVSSGEFAVLELLYHKGPTLLGEIQRGVLMSSGGITFLVDRLADKGLVERRDCPTDRRARYAALTKEGEKLLKRIFPRHARRLADVMSGLTLDEQRAATDLLKRLGLAAAAQGPEK